MAELKNASFIPKQSNRPQRRSRTVHKIYILSYISYVLFFGTLLVVAGTYFYGIQIDRTLQDQKQMLSTEREKFSQNDIQKVRNLERRLLVANTLVSEARAPSQIFTALEDVITDTVHFSIFHYVRHDNKLFSLAVTGVTDTFNDALSQRMTVEDNALLDALHITNFEYSIDDGESGAADGLSIESMQNATSTIRTLIAFDFEGEFSDSMIPYNVSVYQQDKKEEEQTESEQSAEEQSQATSTEPVSQNPVSDIQQ